MTLAWTDEAKKRAKEKRRYLVKLQVQGKYADKVNLEFSGDVGEEIAHKVKEIIACIVAYGPGRDDGYCCDAPGCNNLATSPGFIAGIQANFCEEHAGKYSLLRDPEEEEEDIHSTELEWLQWFVQEADFGPSEGDVTDSLRRRFTKETGKLPAKGWHYWSDGEEMTEADLKELTS